MVTINTKEEVPKEFYIFIGRGNNLFSQINMNNYKLSKKIVSSGITNLMANSYNLKDFIDGDIDYLPYKYTQTTGTLSSFSNPVVKRYSMEHNLEFFRKKHFPNFPSRLSCVYAFGDIDSVNKVIEIYGSNRFNKDNLKKFRLLDMGEFNNAIKVAKCNMNMIDMMGEVELSTFPIEDQEKIYNTYWQCGEILQLEYQASLTERKTISSIEIYEYLIEGILEEIE